MATLQWYSLASVAMPAKPSSGQSVKQFMCLCVLLQWCVPVIVYHVHTLVSVSGVHASVLVCSVWVSMGVVSRVASRYNCIKREMYYIPACTSSAMYHLQICVCNVVCVLPCRTR